jgi:xanthine dehydrogenase accessory factor
VRLFPNILVIKGGGDLASGVAYRVHRVGFPVVMTELPQPLAVRRAVSFAEAVYAGEVTIESITARQVDNAAEAFTIAQADIIAVLVDPEARCVAELKPAVLIDGIMAKRNTGTRLTDAPLVVALGPGFTAGVDCHAVIETQRGHDLGRVLWSGQAQPDTKRPAEIGGYSEERVLRAPRAGIVRAAHAIGDRVEVGEIVACVDDESVRARCPGVVRGLIHDGLAVDVGDKLGDIDPRDKREHCFTISDKALAVGGGVVEAIFAAPQLHGWFMR